MLGARRLAGVGHIQDERGVTVVNTEDVLVSITSVAIEASVILAICVLDSAKNPT